MSDRGHRRHWAGSFLNRCDSVGGKVMMTSPAKHLPTRRVDYVILVILLLVVVIAESVALYQVFTTRFPGGNDFYVRWLGGREYFLHGTNPFDRSVAEKAQMSMFGRLTGPEDKDQAYFAYPLYTLYLFWPLSLIPYAWAQAVWMTVLQFALLGSTFLAMHLSGWRLPGWLQGVMLLWGILFYNGARAILLGQFSILVGLFLLLALWAIERQRDGMAGILLALSTIKPQMVFLILVFLVLWAVVQKRWHLIISFGGSLLALIVSGIGLVPNWPLDFVRNVVAYSAYVAFGTPLENLLSYLLPATIAGPLNTILSICFFLALLPGWWLALRNKPGGFTWAVLSTLIVSSLITFRSATANQVILYLPLFFYFRRITALLGPIAAVLAAVAAAVFMWGVFVATVEGNWEHVMMHGLLPALLLLIYFADWRALWRTAREAELYKLPARRALHPYIPQSEQVT
jgi:hypothetical protein